MCAYSHGHGLSFPRQVIGFMHVPCAMRWFQINRLPLRAMVTIVDENETNTDQILTGIQTAAGMTEFKARY